MIRFVYMFKGLLVLMLVPLASFGGGIRDSVFELPHVEVRAYRFISGESTGVKHTRIDSLLLIQKSHLSLSELLSENTPVFIKSYGRGGLATASFRGTSGTHTRLNWNGMPANDPMSGMADFSLFPAFLIDELTLQHGNASLSAQSGGLGGTVNILSRPDWNNKLDVSYMQGIGSYSTFNEYLKLSMGNKLFQYRLRAYHEQSANDFSFLNRSIVRFENGTVVHPEDRNKGADFGKYGLLQELYVRPGGMQTLSFRWWSQHASRGIPRSVSYEGPENAMMSRQKDTDHRLVAEYKRYSEHGRLLLRSGYAGKQMTYNQMSLQDQAEAQPALHAESQSRMLSNHAAYRHRFSEYFVLDNSIDVRHDRVSTLDTVINTGYEQQRLTWSYLFSARNRFFNILDVSLMLRQDWIDNDRTPLMPFLGFDLQLAKRKDVVLQANMARNYNQASLNDLFWQPGGNPDLMPEEGVTVELGLRYSERFNRQFLRGGIGVFRSDINNWIIWIPTREGFWRPMNIKRVLSYGIESHLDVDGALGPLEYRMRATYALTKALNYGDTEVWGTNTHRKQLVYVPVHSGNILFHIAYKSWYFGWQYNAYSERFTTSSNDVSRRDWLYPYFMNDVHAGKKIDTRLMHITTEVRVHNLFDETYHTVLYRPMPGRNYMVVITINRRITS